MPRAWTCTRTGTMPMTTRRIALRLPSIVHEVRITPMRPRRRVGAPSSRPLVPLFRSIPIPGSIRSSSSPSAKTGRTGVVSLVAVRGGETGGVRGDLVGARVVGEEIDGGGGVGGVEVSTGVEHLLVQCVPIVSLPLPQEAECQYPYQSYSAYTSYYTSYDRSDIGIIPRIPSTTPAASPNSRRRSIATPPPIRSRHIDDRRAINRIRS